MKRFLLLMLFPFLFGLTESAGAHEGGASAHSPGTSTNSPATNEVGITRTARRTAGAKEFGTQDLSIVSYSGNAMFGYRGSDNDSLAGTGTLRHCTNNCFIQVQVSLPTGVMVDILEVDFVDDDAVGSVEATFLKCPFNLGVVACGVIASAGTTGAGTPGNSFTSVTDIGHTIDNGSGYYFIQAHITGGTSNTGLEGVLIWYQRQVSPAPGSATFGDVPTGHAFFQHVEALAASGITAGCGGGDFCPDAPLTRGQMAVFLAAALGLHWDL